MIIVCFLIFIRLIIIIINRIGGVICFEVCGLDSLFIIWTFSSLSFFLQEAATNGISKRDDKDPIDIIFLNLLHSKVFSFNSLGLYVNNSSIILICCKNYPIYTIKTKIHYKLFILRFPLSRENTQFSAAIFFYKKI